MRDMSGSKTVLIIGASGLVGTAVANSFAASGWEVITASRRKPDLLHDDFQHFALDLKNIMLIDMRLKEMVITREKGA